jgi:outer membrane receptor protein involved in Fe transport
MPMQEPKILPCVLVLTMIFTAAGASPVDTADNPPTSGQTTGSSGSAGSSSSEGLEEITVTATRRAQSVEKVPISIEALDQKALTENGIKSISDLAAEVPGLNYMANGTEVTLNYTTISIRGFNTSVGASTVGIYLDDTPLQSRMSPIGNVGSVFPYAFDLDRVEVLRGPQGSLFGASSESGAIRFVTNQPSLTDFSGYAHSEFSYTEYGAPNYDAGVAAGGPIVENESGYRVSAWYHRDGGYVNQVDPLTGQVVIPDVNSAEKGAVRAILEFKVADTMITPSMHFQWTTDNGNNAFWYPLSNVSTGHFSDGDFVPDTGSEHLAVPALKIQTPLSFADLTFNTSYVNRSFNETFDEVLLTCGIFNCGGGYGGAYPTSPSQAAPSNTGLVMRGFTEELRLTSNDPSAFFTWLGGLYHSTRRQQDYQSSLASPVFAGSLGNPIYYTNQTVWDQNSAIFAQGDLHPTDKLTVTVGGRWEIDKYVQHNQNGSGAFSAGLPPYSSSPPGKETPFLPKASISYQLDPDNMLYTSVGKGLRVGGDNAGIPTFCGEISPATYQPDYIWSYEIGAKDRFLDGRLQLDSSVFHVRWSKIQTSIELACGQAYTQNLGTAESDGFDMALAALVTDQLKLQLNVGYADAHYADNSYDAYGHPVAIAGYGIQALGPTVPPWDVIAAANYLIPLANGDKINLRPQWIYHSHNGRPQMSDVPNSPAYLPADVADPVTHLTNLRAEYSHERLTLGLFANNVFNAHPLLNPYQANPSTTLIEYDTFTPRTVGISANYAF